MKRPFIRLILVLILVSISCSLPASAMQQPSPQAVSQLPLATMDPNATATPTPFQPAGKTTTGAVKPSGGTSTGEPSLTPTPNKRKVPKGQIELMVFGSDYRPSSGYRTDIMMLVSINTNTHTVTVVSFPRDLYVPIPGWTTQRLNTAFPHGGFEMFADTIEENFGVRPQYYVMTNFQGFVSIINSLGGINVQVGQYLSDTCDLPQRDMNGYCTVNPGTVTMDGATALWYVRSRHTTNDLDRTRRAQEVLYAVFAKLMSLNAVQRLPELYAAYSSSVETNMDVKDMLPLLPTASKVISDSSLIKRYTFGSREVSNYVTETGAMVLLPNYDAIQEIIDEAVFGLEE